MRDFLRELARHSALFYSFAWLEKSLPLGLGKDCFANFTQRLMSLLTAWRRFAKQPAQCGCFI